MLKRRPDLHALLCQPMPRSRFGEEAGGEHIVYDLPIFGVRDGKLTSHFSLKDDASNGQDRLLMRLWLGMLNSRALPVDHAVLWGDVRAGRPHGGIAQPAVASLANVPVRGG